MKIFRCGNDKTAAVMNSMRAAAKALMLPVRITVAAIKAMPVLGHLYGNDARRRHNFAESAHEKTKRTIGNAFVGLFVGMGGTAELLRHIDCNNSYAQLLIGASLFMATTNLLETYRGVRLDAPALLHKTLPCTAKQAPHNG